MGAVASLVETCKLNGVDPQRYFTDLLTRLVNGWPNDRIDELMPWCWADCRSRQPQPTAPRVPNRRLPLEWRYGVSYGRATTHPNGLMCGDCHGYCCW